MTIRPAQPERHRELVAELVKFHLSFRAKTGPIDDTAPWKRRREARSRRNGGADRMCHRRPPHPGNSSNPEHARPVRRISFLPLADLDAA
jgi:hypothetical protein